MRTIVPRYANLVPKEAKQVFTGILYDVYQWDQTMFDGSKRPFEMLKRPDTVKVLAVKDGKIVMLHEEQPGIPPAYELPGGRHDVPDETEEACAKRELHEETGMIFKTYKLLDAYQPLTKIEAFVYIFLATDFERQETPHEDGGEKITIELVSYEQCLAYAEDKGQGKYLPKDILEQAGSIEGLLALPEYSV
jgi:ADP-ribose pyrophosphatase